jgi:hypothetical protein
MPALMFGGLADHAIAYLGILRQLNADAAGQFPFLQNVDSHLDGANHRRAGIFGMIEGKEADVLVPGSALRFPKLRLDDKERWLAFAGKNRDVVTFHRPVIREVEDVVGCANDNGVKVVALHHLADAAPFFLIEWVSHYTCRFAAACLLPS